MQKTICDKEGHSYLVVKSWSEDMFDNQTGTSYSISRIVYKVLVVCSKCADIRIVALEDIKDS